MYYVGSIPCIETDIRHYGIPGMKWGQRRWQYDDGRFNEAGKARYFGDNQRYGASNTNDYRKKLDAIRDQGNRQDIKVDREKTKKGGNEAAINFAARAAMHLVTLNPIGAASDIKQGIDAVSASEKAKAYFKNREKRSIIDPKTGLYKKSKETSEEDDVKAVNPEFKSFNSNSKNNCMLCTTTYDLRRRGYDVTAQKDSEGYNFNDLKRWYPKAQMKTISSESSKSLMSTTVFGNKDMMQRTHEELTKQGNGARGNIMVNWTQGGGGHSMVYEVKGSSLIIRDCQSGKTYKNPDKILKKASGVRYVRLDNVEPDIKRIKKEVVR